MKKEVKLLSDIKKFCSKLRPVEDICYLEHEYNEQLIPLAKKYNLLGIPMPSTYGGRGMNNITYAHALAAFGREGTGVRTFFSGHTSLGQKMIEGFGSAYVKKTFLKPSIKGTCTLAYGLTEPSAGSDPLSLKMTYREKNGQYVLNGIKYLISNAGIADAMVVFARGKDKRISAFVIDAHEKGCNRETMTAKMGMPTSNTGMFELKNYICPRNHLLGKKGDGWNIAHHGLMSGRLSVAAGCVGVIEDCLIEAMKFAKERVQHKKVIAKHQLIQDHLAMIKMQQESSRLMVKRAAELKDVYEAKATKENMAAADNAICEAKYHAANASFDAANRAVQILGGRGWSFLYRPGRHLVDTRVCSIYEGTNEMMKLKIAAGMLGKDYKAYS